jgi:O-antigen/teichoic acid export membrane protein
MLNIKVGMLFYVLTIVLAFWSRRVFLSCLGEEFIGLTGILYNIMSYLSVVELGIGTSIVVFLYKPLQEDNREKINEVMSMLAFLYRCIGFIIGGLGVLVSLFFPWWFNHLTINLGLVYFAFYSFLGSSIIGYLFNYRQLLVSANQKQYLVNAYFQTIGIVQSITQILLAYYYKNLYLWVAVGLVFTIIGCMVFNYRIRQIYPWLHIDLKEGRQNLKKYPEVLHKTKQIFWQKIKNLVQHNSDELLVGVFVSIPTVALYGNYTIITGKFNFLVNILSDGFSAGVGNLLAEGNERNTMKVYWEMTATRFLILGIILFPLIMYIQPFIGCWLGDKYMLSNTIVYLLIMHLFLYYQNGTVQIFVGAAGLFGDVWAAWTELALYLALTLALAPHYGIAGILLGKVISVFFFSALWKPYYLFKNCFRRSVWEFWKGMTPYYLIFFIFTLACIFIKSLIVSPMAHSFPSLILIGLLTGAPLLLLYFLTLFIFTKGTKYFVARKPRIYAIINCLSFKKNIYK